MQERQPTHRSWIDVDDAVLPFEAGAGRTGVDAGRILTMVAQHRQEEIAHGRVLAFLGFEHSCVVNAGWGAVLGLAGELAAVATDATLEIDHHSPSHGATSTGTTRTFAHRSRLLLTGLTCSQSSSSSSLKNTPLPLAIGIPSLQCPHIAAMPMPSGWMASVSFSRPLTLRPASFSTHTSWPSRRAFLRASVGIDRDRVGERIELRRFVQPRVLHGEAVGVDDVAVVEGVEIEILFLAAMRRARQEIRQRLVIFHRDLEAARLGDRSDLVADRQHEFPVDRHPHVDERPPINLLGLLLPLDEALLLEPLQAALGAEIILQLGVANLRVGILGLAFQPMWRLNVERGVVGGVEVGAEADPVGKFEQHV